MGKDCAICKEPTGLFAHKIYNGVICRKCRAYLPARIQLKASDTDYLLGLYERNKELAKSFEATSHYGYLFLDSIHGLFCFSKGEKSGEPTEFGDIFSIKELTETGIYCSDIRNVGSGSANKVVCNIKMKVTTDAISMEYMVAENEPCKYTHGKNHMLEVHEPEKLTMFRNMFYQMIDNEMSRVLRKLEEIKRLRAYAEEAENTPLASEVNWARGVLFLKKDEATPEKIKSRYRELMHIFHPDLHPDLDDAYAQKLNEAYGILKPK